MVSLAAFEAAFDAADIVHTLIGEGTVAVNRDTEIEEGSDWELEMGTGIVPFVD